MVIILAVKGLDMQGDAGRLGEGLEPFLEQLGVHLAELRPREADLPDEIRPVRAVERDAGQGPVHRDQCAAVTNDALEVAERLRHGLRSEERRVWQEWVSTV